MPLNSKLLHFLSPKNSLSALPPPALLSTHNSNKHSLTSPLSLPESVPAMDSQPPCRLVLCGKSSAEKELAKSIRNSKALKLPDDAELEIISHSDPETTPLDENCFRHDSFFSSLSTTRFGRFLIWSPRLPSTHDVVSHNFCELPIGTACVTDVQYKGRGRSQNTWESPRGCLMFSFTMQMEDGRVVPLVQYVVCLAMTEAINDVCHKNGIPYLHVRIKWPNDLYLNGLKVGGILCTSTYRSKKFNVTAGIGLNIDNEQPTTCLNAVLQQLTSISYQLQREDILAAFFNKFEDLFDLFIDKVTCRKMLCQYSNVLFKVLVLRDGQAFLKGREFNLAVKFLAHTEDNYNDIFNCLILKENSDSSLSIVTWVSTNIIQSSPPASLIKGDQTPKTGNGEHSTLLRLTKPYDSYRHYPEVHLKLLMIYLSGFQPLEQLYYQAWLHSGQRVIVQEKDDNQLVEKVVTVQGLTSSGYLLAVGEDGQMCELHPDGNSFDFFKGLVRRKLT